MSGKSLVLCASILLATALSPSAKAQVPTDLPDKFPGFHLQNQGVGKDECLAILTNKADKVLAPRMAPCKPNTGQFWTLAPTADKGFYRIHLTSFRSDLCLTHSKLAVTGGLEGLGDKTHLAPCNKSPSQLWEVKPVQDKTWAGRGLNHLRTKDSGEKACLTRYAETKADNEAFQMRPCKENEIQQMWRISPMFTVLAKH